MGIASTLGYDYIHGNLAYGGLQIPELYHTCYSYQIEFLMDNTWKDTLMGKTIAIALQHAYVEIGLCDSIFSDKTQF